LHNGEAVTLVDLDDDPDTITFETNKFSTFALAHNDVRSNSSSDKEDDEDDDNPADKEDDEDEDDDEDKTSKTERIEISVGDSEYIEIELEEYDANEATISIVRGDKYVSINKTLFTTAGKLKIVGKEEGNAKIEIEFDTGDILIINIEVVDDSSSDKEDDEDDDEDKASETKRIEISVGDDAIIEIDLEKYDADEAIVSIIRGDKYISIDKSLFTSNGQLKIVGVEEGKARIDVEFDTGDKVIINVNVVDESDEEDDSEDKPSDTDDDKKKPSGGSSTSRRTSSSSSKNIVREIKVTDENNKGNITIAGKGTKNSIVKAEVKTEKGYKISSVIIKSESGQIIETEKLENGIFSFTMPDENIEIIPNYEINNQEVIVLGIDNVNAQVFGNTVVNDVAPVIRNSRAMLPIRFIIETIGGKVVWDGENNKVSIKFEETEIVIYIGSEYAYKNGEQIQLDSPAFIENDRTYLPIRFVSENLGRKVLWDDETREVIMIP